jgi:hypothetical protein
MLLFSSLAKKPHNGTICKEKLFERTALRLQLEMLVPFIRALSSLNINDLPPRNVHPAGSSLK